MGPKNETKLASPNLPPDFPEPDVVVRTEDSPSRRGRAVGPHERLLTLLFLLDDGRVLAIECGDETCASLRQLGQLTEAGMACLPAGAVRN